MAHNIDPGVNNVLTILDLRGNEAHFGFPRSESTPPVLPYGFGIRVNNSTVARIEGEDLFALRELLNELPEEAFVRPADPVSEVFTLVDGEGDVWGFEGDYWRCGEDSFGLPYWTDFQGFDSWEEIANLHGIDDGIDPEPEWIEGDVIVFEGQYVSSVYMRGSETWTRVRTRGITHDPKVTPGLADARIDSWLLSPYSYRVIRKGGVDL